MKRMKLRTTTYVFALMALLFAISCDDAETDPENGVATPDDKGNPLWTIHAALEGVPNTDGDIHLAFIWQSSSMNSQGAEKNLRIATDVPISSDSLLSVDLNIYDLPDESVLTSTDENIPSQLFTWEYSNMVDEYNDYEPIEHPTVKWAIGKLVLYEDLNNNGMLDLLQQSATEGIDRIVGGALHHEFFYIESELEHPFEFTPEITRGLNLVSTLETKYDRLPISLENDVSIELNDSLESQRVMCPNMYEPHWQDGLHDGEKSCSVVPASELLSHFPMGITPMLDGHCANNGFIFEWYDIELTGDALCQTELRHGDYYLSRIPTDQPVPDYWPCEIEESEHSGEYPELVTQYVLSQELGMFDMSAVDTCTDLISDLITEFEGILE